jgi:trehalose 6-phosphate synthase
MRWEAMMAKLRQHTIQQWFADFVDALQKTQIDKPTTARLMIEASTLRPVRSANSGAR